MHSVEITIRADQRYLTRASDMFHRRSGEASVAVMAVRGRNRGIANQMVIAVRVKSTNGHGETYLPRTLSDHHLLAAMSHTIGLT